MASWQQAVNGRHPAGRRDEPQIGRCGNVERDVPVEREEDEAHGGENGGET